MIMALVSLLYRRAPNIQKYLHHIYKIFVQFHSSSILKFFSNSDFTSAKISTPLNFCNSISTSMEVESNFGALLNSHIYEKCVSMYLVLKIDFNRFLDLNRFLSSKVN